MIGLHIVGIVALIAIVVYVVCFLCRYRVIPSGMPKFILRTWFRRVEYISGLRYRIIARIIDKRKKVRISEESFNYFLGGDHDNWICRI